MKRTRRRRLWLVLVWMVIAAMAAACGGTGGASQDTTSSAPTSGSGSSTSSSAGSAHHVSAAKVHKAALAAAKAAGPATKVSSKTIGYLRFTAADSSDQRIYKAFVSAAKVLGWKVIPCDGKGNPSTMAKCMNTLLARHPDAIVNDGIPQSSIAAGLRRAKSEGIPTVYTGGSLAHHDLYTAGYVPPDTKMSQLLSAYIVKQLGQQPGTQQAIVQTNAASWGQLRDAAFMKAVKGTNIKVVAKPSANATNLVQGTRKQIGALLTRYPDAKLVLVTFDGAVSGAAQAVASKFAGKSFPQAPMVATFYGEEQTLHLIREGKVTVIVAEPLEWCSWAAADQLAEHFARKKPMSNSVRPDYGPGMKFWQPTIVTKANLPPEGQLVPPTVDYASFFKTKWHAEFGVG